MTKRDLIYDWRKSESSFRDKLSALIIVTMLFGVFWGACDIRYSTPRSERSGSASILRFKGKDDGLARFWLLQAEEGGPFPGRLELSGEGGALSVEGIDGTKSWNTYRSQFRPIGEEEGYSREKLASKGVRVFPSRFKTADERAAAPPVAKKVSKEPILIPYSPEALAWMPDDLPQFVLPEGAASAPATWRFAVNLAEDGTVRESISLGGGDDDGQGAMEGWLRGVRFKPAEGDRWLGLRVEFVNRQGNGTEPE